DEYRARLRGASEASPCFRGAVEKVASALRSYRSLARSPGLALRQRRRQQDHTLNCRRGSRFSRFDLPDRQQRSSTLSRTRVILFCGVSGYIVIEGGITSSCLWRPKCEVLSRECLSPDSVFGDRKPRSVRPLAGIHQT